MMAKDRKEKPKKEFEETLLEVRRVTRVNTGGRQLSFRAIILVGNKNGKIGLGVSKGSDVQVAVRKATNEAYKNMKVIPITENGSIPYEVSFKYKSAIIKVIPASAGTGLKAGSSLRAVLELAGYTNILSKIMGTNNKLNNALATIMALNTFKVDRTGMATINVQELMETRKKEQADADAERASQGERKRPRASADASGAPASGGAGAQKRRPTPKK
jgi:small subunit ribosomal protein S5